MNWIVYSRRVCLALLTCAATVAAAQTPLRIVNADQPGGSMDALIRPMADKLAQVLQRPVLVDNKPGGLGRIAVDAVLGAKPDGNTILITVQAGIVINPHVYKYPYDPLTDLVPITDLGRGSLLLVSAPHVPAKNFGELVRWIKTQPSGKVAYATYGAGTISHFGGLLLGTALNTDVLAVHYKASGDSVRDLVGGRVDFAFTGAAGPIAQLIKAGRLNVHAYMGKQRLAAFPDLPTLRELSYADVEAEGWIGIFAPKNTPKKTIAKLQADIASVLKSPEIAKTYSNFGFDPGGSPHQEFAQRVRWDSEEWARYIKKINYKPE